MIPPRALGAVVAGGVILTGVVVLATTSADRVDAAISGNALTAFSECRREVALLLGSPTTVVFAPSERSAVTRDAGAWRFQSFADITTEMGTPSRTRWLCTADPLLNDTFAIDAQLID